MNSGLDDPRCCEHAELASLYALRALPPGEASALEAHLSTCAACRQEVDRLRPTVAALGAWPDLQQPPGSLWGRLSRRIAEEAGTEALPEALAPQAAPEPAWEEVAPGIACKLLAIDVDRDRLSLLVRLAPGGEYPTHLHAGTEELYLLDGELCIDGRQLHAGDYRRASAGTFDQRVRSETGCTCVLITSASDAIF